MAAGVLVEFGLFGHDAKNAARAHASHLNQLEGEGRDFGREGEVVDQGDEGDQFAESDPATGHEPDPLGDRQHPADSEDQGWEIARLHPALLNESGAETARAAHELRLLGLFLRRDLDDLDPLHRFGERRIQRRERLALFDADRA